ncbi:hypothetical protein ACR9E3_18935 [Actinomycetospora sp. C-140]
MTSVSQPFEVPAARPVWPEVRTLLTTVTYLVVGGALVLLGVLLAPSAAVTVAPPAPAAPAAPAPVMRGYDTTGGLIWNLYEQAGGPRVGAGGTTG